MFILGSRGESSGQFQRTNSGGVIQESEERVDLHSVIMFMKSILLFCISLFLFTACSQDGKNIVPSGVFSSVLPQRNWVVNYLQINGNDRVYQFSGYKFGFVRDGSVQAQKGSETIPGNWGSVTSGSKSVLYFDFGTAQIFNQLNGSWDSVEMQSDMLRFERTNGTSGNKDYLTLYLY